MILHIAKRGPHNIAAAVHIQALKDIYGEQNIFFVDLLPGSPKFNKNYVAYGKYKNIFDRMHRWVEGNTSYISNKIIFDICRIIEERNIDMVFTEESDLGNLVKEIKRRDPRVKIICFYHDISADLFTQRKKQAAFWKLHYKYIECPITIRQEKINQMFCDENWVFHNTDAERFYKYYKKKVDVMIPIASPVPIIDEKMRNVITKQDNEKKLLFVCSKYYVNIRGFMWFYRNVLPSLEGNFQIDVVGTGSFLLKNKCHDARINFIGPVDQLSEYYLRADIVLVPIFDGGGMKVKVIEALSYAKCIVGTSESLHGVWEALPDNLKNCIVYNTDEAAVWIRVLNRLLYSDVNKFNYGLFQVFIEKFSYEAMLKQFKMHLIS